LRQNSSQSDYLPLEGFGQHYTVFPVHIEGLLLRPNGVAHPSNERRKCKPRLARPPRPTVRLTCANCGIEFERYKSSVPAGFAKTYCGLSCSAKAHARPVTMVQLTCEFCGKQFERRNDFSSRSFDEQEFRLRDR